MLYNRFWFDKDRYGVTLDGGAMANPGRYLTLVPPINGADAISGSPYFTQNPGDPFNAWDTSATFDWMPQQYITFRWEYGYRHANVPYFSGSGGITPGVNLSPSIIPGLTAASVVGDTFSLSDHSCCPRPVLLARREQSAFALTCCFMVGNCLHRRFNLISPKRYSFPSEMPAYYSFLINFFANDLLYSFFGCVTFWPAVSLVSLCCTALALVGLFERYEEAERAHNRSIDLMGQKVRKLAPHDSRIQFLLAKILLLSERWLEASELLEQLAADESAFFSTDFFLAVVRTNHLEEALAILERTGASERWRPLYEALRAARDGTPDYLRTVAPEVRMAALTILRDLTPELFIEKGIDARK